MNNDRLRQMLVLLGFVFAIVMNGLVLLAFAQRRLRPAAQPA